MTDVTKYNAVCPSCGSKVAKNMGPAIKKPLSRRIGTKHYGLIEHKPVQCQRKACQRRFVVSRLSQETEIMQRKSTPLSGVMQAMHRTFNL